MTQKICPHYTHDNPIRDCCQGHRTGVLTGKEIKDYGVIVSRDRDDTASLKATSYDLRLGEGHMVYDSIGEKWKVQWVSPDILPREGIPPYDCDNTTLVIPKFGMALVQLREEIDLLSCMRPQKQPAMICGHFDLKLSRVREGLISQQATQVEPGYKGKLFCYLFNQTGNDISLSYTDNDKIATIEFQYVSCISQCDDSIRSKFLEPHPEEHEKYRNSTYCNDHGIDDVRFFASKLPKHGGLSSIVQLYKKAQQDALEGCALEIQTAGKEHRITWKFILALGSALITLVGIIITLLILIFDNGVFEKQAQISDLHSATHKELTSVTTEINKARAELASVATEMSSAKDALRAMRNEAQSTYVMAINASIELDIKREVMSKLETITATKQALIAGNEIAEKGGKP